MERKSAIHFSPRTTEGIVGTARELEILDLLQRFDVLPSHYIADWVGSKSATADRLTRLIQGHYAHILEGKGVWCTSCKTSHPFSEDAWLFARLRNVYYPLSLWPRGKALLVKRGMWIERERESDEFDHKIFRSIIDWSFAFGAKQHGLTYETLDQILPRAPWKPTKEDPNPRHIVLRDGSHFVPDSFVKLEGASNFFAHIEIDNNTESQTGEAHSTIQRKVNRYAAYLDDRAFLKRYGLPKITILFFFNKKGRLKNFLDVVRTTVSDPEIQRRFAAMYVPDFRESFAPPTGFTLGTYERVGEPLNIMEIVNAERKGRTDLRPSENNQGRGSGAGTSDGGDPETRPTA